MKKLSAFDMGETIEWYTRNRDKIKDYLPFGKNGRITIEGTLRDISPERLATIRNMFPANALERSVFRSVVAQPETYFLPDAAERIKNRQNPTTTDRTLAMSPTAIVPSFYNPVTWTESDIWLYNIPVDVAPEIVRKTILAEGFTHELGHSLNFLARYKGGNQKLKLPNQTIMTGKECFDHFGELFQKIQEPMSHYSSGYHPGNEFFDSSTPSRTIDEELAETIAAYYLGFAFTPSKERRFNPFADRPEVRKFTEQYLNAKLIMPE